MLQSKLFEENNRTMHVIALIPARGGSKGIPRKNLQSLAGKPLIAHTIEHARQARSVGRVVVSTDDAEIAAVSKQYGAEVVWRPAAISGDTASSESALLHALEYLQQTEGYESDLLVFLQCTSPLTLPEDIDGTVQALWDEIAAEANEVDLTDEERGELDRRLSAYLRDPGHVVTWTDARNHVRGRRR